MVGSTDAKGERPKDAPLSVNDLWATMFRHLDIDPHHTSFNDHQSQPMPVLPEGSPIAELVSGHVDDQLRALVRVPVGASQDGLRQEIVAWVDTAFNGGLTIQRALAAGLRLPQESSIEGVLADGRTVALETFGCYFDWFGGTYQTQVIASDGAFPLLGTLLLSGHRLAIDYAARTVELA